MAAVRAKARTVEGKLEEMRKGKAASMVQIETEETLSYMKFPREQWIRIRTNKHLVGLIRKIQKRTGVVGNFPDGPAALMLAAARVRHLAGHKMEYMAIPRHAKAQREIKQSTENEPNFTKSA